MSKTSKGWGFPFFFEGVRPFSPIWQTLGDGHEIWQIRRLTLKKILLFMMMISFSWFSEKTANPPYLVSFCSNQFGLPMYIMQVSTSRGGDIIGLLQSLQLGPIFRTMVRIRTFLRELVWIWSPSSTYQQLLTVWWVPQQLLQKALFDTFTFEGGWGPKNTLIGRTQVLI